MDVRVRSVTGVVAGAVVVLAVGLVGCEKPWEHGRLNAPPQGDGLAHPGWADYFVYHNDQGMMADMSIADIHFVPHSAELSGVGVARLERYAELLATTGGALRYDPAIRDVALISARVETAKALLAQAIPRSNLIDVVVGSAGGRGMGVAEASAGKAVATEAEQRAAAYQMED
jgi:hypothetical protein